MQTKFHNVPTNFDVTASLFATRGGAPLWSFERLQIWKLQQTSFIYSLQPNSSMCIISLFRHEACCHMRNHSSSSACFAPGEVLKCSGFYLFAQSPVFDAAVAPFLQQGASWRVLLSFACEYLCLIYFFKWVWLNLLDLPLLLQFGHDVVQVLAELWRRTDDILITNWSKS